MPALIDTGVWSLALRRRAGALSAPERRVLMAWRRLVTDGGAALLGIVRQELLSGVRDAAAFDKLCEYTRYFDNLEPDLGGYEQAALCANACRSGGIAFSTVDMLICGVALRNGLEILTTDKDFLGYARVLPIRLTNP